MSVQTVFANGVNPWAMYFKQVFKDDGERVDLEISDDPIDVKKNMERRRNVDVKPYKSHSKYAHNFDKMKAGQCIVCNRISPRVVAEAMCKWIATTKQFDLVAKATYNYNNTGVGRVWLVKA